MNVMMTNAELSEAIAYTFQRCEQKYVGGYTTSETRAGKAMLSHLEGLLAMQLARAGVIDAPNAGNEGPPRSDGPAR